MFTRTNKNRTAATPAARTPVSAFECLESRQLFSTSLPIDNDLGVVDGRKTVNDQYVFDDERNISKFKINAAGTVDINLTGLTDDVDLALWKQNGTGWDYVAGSANYDSTPERITRQLSAGTYAVDVDGTYVSDYYTDDDDYYVESADYDLQITLDTAGNTLASPRQVGALTQLKTFKDFVGDSDKVDLMKFTVSTRGTFWAELSGLSSDADISLIRDANRNNVIDSGDVVQSSTNSGTAKDTITRTVDPGTYFLRVAQWSGNTNYTMKMFADGAGNTMRTATNLGTINPGSSKSAAGYVGSNDKDDWFKFNLGTFSDVTVKMSGLLADADMELVEDSNRNGVYDSDDYSVSEALYGNATEIVYDSLPAGTYFVRVSQWSGNTNYSLNVSAY
jgi:hypothetical protein